MFLSWTLKFKITVLFLNFAETHAMEEKIRITNEIQQGQQLAGLIADFMSITIVPP
jgi:hypothetical protein